MSTKSKTATFTKRRVAIALLLPHPKNPRVHPEEGSQEWQRLSRSLGQDYFDPIVWNKRNGMLVSGHFRVKIFRSKGIREVDVVEVDYDEPTHLGRMIAANKLFGTDDLDLQGSILAELSALKDFDMGLTGLGTLELEEFGIDLGGAFVFENSSPDAAPAPAPLPSAAPVRTPQASPTAPAASELNPAPDGPATPPVVPPSAEFTAPEAADLVPATLPPVLREVTMLMTDEQKAEYDLKLNKLREVGVSDSEIVLRGLRVLTANLRASS